MTRAADRMLRLMDRAVEAWQIPILGKAKGRIVKRLLAEHRPRRGLEVGSLLGYSAILIGANLPRGGRLTCVEANPFLAWISQENASRAGLAGHRFANMEARKRFALKKLNPVTLLCDECGDC